MKPPATIDEYILNFPFETQERLARVRATIKKAAPEAQEVISYQMPAFKYKGLLVWFAAYKKHIGFYPKGAAIETFKEEISVYKWAKGSVQFPLDKPLPLGLISKIVKYRVKENEEKAKKK